jgi:hypothetical protein
VSADAEKRLQLAILLAALPVLVPDCERHFFEGSLSKSIGWFCH